MNNQGGVKQLSALSFVVLIKQAKIESSFELVERNTAETYDGKEYEMEWGWLYNSLKATKQVGGDAFVLDVVFQAAYEHPRHKPSKATICPQGSEGWQFNTIDFEVINDDGEQLAMSEIEDLLFEHTDICRLSLSVLGDDSVLEIDLDNDEEYTMETIILENDDSQNIKFVGELIGSASSDDNNASGSYSGSTGRWTELSLYKTQKGTLIGQSIGRTRWEGEYDLYKTKVFKSEAEAIEFFGQGWLAKELYHAAGIENVLVVE